MGGKPSKNKRYKSVAKEIRVSDNSLVTKSNQLVEARYRLSLREQRFILLMISMVEPKDETFTHYKVPSKQLIEALGLEKEKDAYKRLKQIVRGLQKRLLYIEHPDGVIEAQWVGAVNYRKKGVMEIEISSMLKPYLLQLKKQFTRYRLKNVFQLQSAYTIRMYELMKQYEGAIGKRRMTVKDLRAYLGIEDEKYKMYANLKDRVLNPAQKELSKKTDISFTFDEIKQGRKVVELQFTIKPSKPKENLFPAPLDEQLPLLVKEMIRVGVSKRVAMKIWREEWGFLDDEARKQIKPLISDGLQFEQYIRDKLELLKKASKQADIPSRGGWISRALKENWTNTEQDKKRKRVKQKADYQRRIREEDERRDKEDEEARNKRARDAQLDSQYITLSPSQQEGVNRAVFEQLLGMDDFKSQRVEIERVADEISSGEGFFQKLPAGVGISAQRIRREIVATIE